MRDKEIRAAATMKPVEDGGKMIIEGKAIAFDSPTVLYTDERGNKYMETISSSSLDQTDFRDCCLRYNHKDDVPILARTRGGSLQLEKKPDGLYFRAELFSTQTAKDCYELVKADALQCSFCFTIAQNGDMFDEKTRTRTITNISRVLDLAICDIPAYDDTFVKVARSYFKPKAEKIIQEYDSLELKNLVKDYVPEEHRGNKIGSIADKVQELMINYDSTTKQWKAGEPENLYSKLEEIGASCRMQEIAFEVKNSTETPTNYLQEAKVIQKALDIAIEQRKKTLARVVQSGGVGEAIGEPERENKMENENRTFYDQFVEERAAGSSSNMSAVIPTTIMDQYVLEKAPGALYEKASKTNIIHSGILKLPIATLQPVEKHTENASITDSGYVPTTLEIKHSEYAYNTAYSDLGTVISAASFEQVINNTLMGSMMKKMDGICLDAIASATYQDGTNAVEYTKGGAPTYAEFVELAGYLGADYLDAAAWYCSPTTYFNLLLGLKDTQNRPILSASEKVENQAFMGYAIKLDSQIPNNVIYFGDASRIHLNYARYPELNTWTDFDHNTNKAGVRCVAGAAAETGCMVKMSEATA